MTYTDNYQAYRLDPHPTQRMVDACCARIAELEAELAALKGRCCNTCAWTTCWVWSQPLSPSWYDAEEGIMCRLWTARAEEGGGE
jgi:hypothetical protein